MSGLADTAGHNIIVAATVSYFASPSEQDIIGLFRASTISHFTTLDVAVSASVGDAWFEHVVLLVHLPSVSPRQNLFCGINSLEPRSSMVFAYTFELERGNCIMQILVSGSLALILMPKRPYLSTNMVRCK
jgi:hypothetical protein